MYRHVNMMMLLVVYTYCMHRLTVLFTKDRLSSSCLNTLYCKTVDTQNAPPSDSSNAEMAIGQYSVYFLNCILLPWQHGLPDLNMPGGVHFGKHGP